MSFHSVVESIALVVESIGVLVLVGGLAYGVFSFLQGVRSEEDISAYAWFRRELGRTIILGLEILVIGDIIYTIASPLSFESLGVLGLLILIRSFLSIQIEMELDGRWPWNRGTSRTQEASGE